jgi:hypothetical protein
VKWTFPHKAGVLARRMFDFDFSREISCPMVSAIPVKVVPTPADTWN